MTAAAEGLTPYWEGEGVTLYFGDARAVMARLPAESMDAIVTDPPYGLEFMGKEWDKLLVKDRHVAYPSCRHAHGPNAYVAGLQAQEWHHSWAIEALRVLKPGGDMVVFGGTRTHHRLWCAVEDAGFEIRDCLMWLYGQGFPKSLDISRAIDKAVGAKGVPGGYRTPDHAIKRKPGNKRMHEGYQRPWRDDPEAEDRAARQYIPATDAARQWQGWGTALKPAWESILLARKPLSERTVAANVQRWGTGALNIDACRIEGQAQPFGDGTRRTSGIMGKSEPRGRWEATTSGRWPANLVLDEEAAAMLDAQSGDSAERSRTLHHYSASGFVDDGQGFQTATHGDSGGASRFFYTSKAGPDERAGGKHPTEKPRDLMLWLCKLVTPPGGLILDPFIGSGTTAVAVRMGGFRCVGIENNEEYLSHAAQRLRLGDEGLAQVVEARRQGAEQLRLENA